MERLDLLLENTTVELCAHLVTILYDCLTQFVRHILDFKVIKLLDQAKGGSLDLLAVHDLFSVAHLN